MKSLRVNILFLFFSIIQINTKAQLNSKLLLDIKILKSLLATSSRLSPFDEKTLDNDSISLVNQSITNKLGSILTDSQISKQNLYPLLKNESLNIVYSEDKKLWIFNWFENTGGTFKSNISVLNYRTSSGTSKVAFDESSNNNEQNENLFPSGGAWFEKIYKLPSKGKNLYLCIGNGVSCNTCIYSKAVVVELKDESINFNYEAFPLDKYADTELSVFTLNARLDNIEKFEFNPKTNILTYIYLTDDNTPIQSKTQKRIVRKLYFNGLKFTSLKTTK